jgi:hypothetical protein
MERRSRARRWARGWAVAALLLAAPVAAPAQPPAPSSPEIPPDALTPNADARALFERLAAQPAEGDLFAALDQQALAPMDAVIEQSLARGAQVANWSELGKDLRADLAARAGGTAGNMVEGATPFGLHRIYFSDEPIEGLVPANRVLVGRLGAPFETGIVRMETSQMSPKVILVERIGYVRRGNALCRDRSQSRLYADPAVAASEMDMIAVVITLRMLPRLERHNLCQVFEESQPGSYTLRQFDGLGYRLGGLEGIAPYRIVARVPVSTRPDRP